LRLKKVFPYAAAATCLTVILTGCQLKGPFAGELDKATVDNQKELIQNQLGTSYPSATSQEDGIQEAQKVNNQIEPVATLVPSQSPIKIKEEEDILLSLGPPLIKNYRSVTYKDTEYPGYGDLSYFTKGYQTALKENAKRTKTIIAGRRIVIEPYEITSTIDDLKIEGKSAVLLVHLKEKGIDANEHFDRSVTARVSFIEQEPGEWLADDVQFSEDDTDF